jgi:hypothetical protein
MMIKAILFLSAAMVVACNRGPFVEHELKFEKVADDCSKRQSYFRLNSNFGGERYEFEECLPADFNKDQLVSERRGDTVVISFRSLSAGQKTVVYHITLDIDSYPRYNFLTVGDNTYTIAPSQK